MPTPTELYDYYLPPELIAQEPLADRTASRLLVLRRKDGRVSHRAFREAPDMLRPGDLLIVNNSKVFPARLFARKDTGAEIELLFLRELEAGRWEALAKPGKRLREGTALFHDAAPGGRLCRAIENKGDGIWTFELAPEIAAASGGLEAFLAAHGETPLPPYVKKKIDDPERYQTVYAAAAGSTAAPTAGMHFTGELLKRAEEAGAKIASVTLHIGLGTFKPVSAECLEDHRMHTERFIMPDETAAAVRHAKLSGGRVIAVGTTSARTLESWALRGGDKLPERGAAGDTSLFIYRREQFRVVDAMITNFHLPRTTLLAMICAFAGRDHALAAYREAVEAKYRFFSFGDAMMIV